MNTKAVSIKNALRGTHIYRAVIILIVLLVVYPIIFVVITSLKSTREFYTNVWGLPKALELGNYSYAWVTGNIGTYFVNSIIVVSITVLFTIVFGAMAGYALARLKIPYANIILAAILFSAMLPSESIIMPLYIMMNRVKLIGGLSSLYLPYIGWWLPITIYIFKNFFAALPEEILEAARIDGCPEAKIFIFITSPLMLPAIATCAILNFVSSWGELLWASIVLSTSTLRTIPLGILAFQSQFATDWGPLSAAISIVLLPLVVFFVFTQKYFIQGISAGAVKG